MLLLHLALMLLSGRGHLIRQGPLTSRFSSGRGPFPQRDSPGAEAEIEVRFDLLPNLTVGADGTTSRSLTVDIRPDIWFRNADGSLLALHLWDYALTGRLLEFEVEMRDGFTEIEIDT